MNGRVKRRLVWETKGVSEIVGTILMLAITVVMFSSIIAYVGRIPPPQEAFHVELKCNVVPKDASDWGNGTYFDIQHRGGEELDALFIKIFLSVDAVTLTRTIPQGLVDDNNNGLWGVSETWRVLVENIDLGFSPQSTMTYSVLIVNSEKNAIVWQETINAQKNTFGPIILNAWIDSDLGTMVDDAGPISYQDPFRIYARVMDPEGMDPTHGLNPLSIWVNLSSVQLGTVQLLDVVDNRSVPGDDVYEAVIDTPPSIDEASPGYYHFVFNASDFDNNSVQRSVVFPVGIIIGDNPQIWVYDIMFSDPEPVNGDTITISATIRNVGQVGALVDVWFYDENNNHTLIGGSNTNVSMAGLSERDAEMQWKAAPGGVHMVMIIAQINDTYATINRVYDPYLDDNTGFENITVMPKILLVDDDGELNDKGDRDTASFMQASLEASDFEYDFTGVGIGDGPGYDYGDYPLKDYDVVIWMAGYQTTNTLTKTPLTGDIANLQKFLKPTITTNGGSLWFISQGFWQEASTDAELQAFAENYMNVPSMPASQNAALPSLLWGNSTHPVTNYFADNAIDTINRVTSDAKYLWSYYWSGPIAKAGVLGALNSSGTNNFYATSYNSSQDPAGVEDSRIFVQTWEFSRIEDTATQAQLTYKVLMWLGNITQKFTKDVAISEQTVEPEIIFYKQNVTIKFVIRNNGFNNYTASDNLYYLLRITDLYGNDLIVPVLEKVDFLDTGYNNTVTITYNWTPLEIGYHRLAIKVDPWDYIDESNELNNEISDFLTSGEVDVQYRMLVVDDDSSANNGGMSGLLNETAELTGALDYLTSTSTAYTYEMFVVNETLGGFGPPYDANSSTISLNKYNAVLWVTGEYNLTAPLKDNDTIAIMEYLNNSGNIWLIGDGMWTDLNEVVTQFQTDYLRIGSVDGNRGIYSTMIGVRNDAVSHGMQYAANITLGAKGDVLNPAPYDMAFNRPAGTGFFYQDSAMTLFNSVRYEGAPPKTGSSTNYKVATTSWLLSSLNSIYSKAELTFMMLRWFDKPENRIETRLTNMDIWVSNSHPQLGSGYVIQATVYNVGGSTGNVLVRFMDGSTQIGSDSISVMPNEKTTAEVIWIPLFAGSRQLSVLVDPIFEVPEIFEWSNNNASQNIYVYFFWDDMENGTSKWTHSSTVLFINGESPLEYSYTNTNVDTNIITQWDYAMSQNLTNCTAYGFYHTQDQSFWLQEPSGTSTVVTTRKPLDIVLALDTSGSMSGSKLANMKTAATGFIGRLTDQDKAAIWTFNGNGATYLRRYWEFMTQTNRDSFNATINALAAGGYTPFYDMLGNAIQYSLQNDTLGDDSSRYEYVLGLTDGCSNRDYYWTPECSWGTNTTSDPQGYSPWWTDGVGHGITGCPPMVFTIGVNLGTEYGDTSDDHDPAYPVASDDPPYSESYPNGATYVIEYDLWHCANTTCTPLGKYGWNNTTVPAKPLIGHYFYTQTGNDLPAIFDLIFSSIQQSQLTGENQTRSGGSMPLSYSVGQSTFSSNPPPGTMSPGPGPQPMITEVRYMRGVANEVTVNTLTAYSLSTTQSATAQDTGWIGDGGTVYAGIRVWRRSSAGVETEITGGGAVAVANRGTPSWEGIISATWTPTSTALAATDSIVVRVYVEVDDNTPDTQRATFTTQQLNAATLDNAQWTVYYYVRRESAGGGDDRWFWGTSTYNSRIEGFTYSRPAPYIVSTVPANNALEVALAQNIIITFSKAMNPGTVTWACAPLLTGTSSVWSGGDTVLTLSHANFASSTVYTFQVTGGNSSDGVPLTATGSAPNPFIFTTVGPPVIISTTPIDGATGVALNQNVIINFSKPMNTASLLYTCLPLPTGGFTSVWSNGNRTVTLSHATFFTGGQLYTFNVTQARDTLAQDLIAGPVPNPWVFTAVIDNSPWITVTYPADGATGVALAQNIFVNFSEAIDITTLLFTISPNPGGLTWVWGGGNTQLTISHNAFGQGVLYTVTVTQANDTTGNFLVSGPVANPWSFRTFDATPPTITKTTPTQGSTGVGLSQPIIVQFSESMNQAATQAAWVCSPDPTGWTFQWDTAGAKLTLYHFDFDQETTYNCTVVNAAARDLAGNALVAGIVPNPWSFTTGTSGGGEGGGTGISPSGQNVNKSAVTPVMTLSNLESAKLTFWHKYNMMPGANGGYLQVGTKNATTGAWEWKYVIPANAYSGNLRTSVWVNDSFGTRIYWCWNGISGRGTFGWEYVQLNLLDVVPVSYRNEVRVKFTYTQYGGGTGYGWYIDDVRVTVSRANNVNPISTTQDVWNRTNATHHSGNYSWANVDPTNNMTMKPGIDNYLITMPIDLTRAKSAYLSAYFRFNINRQDGAPPDGFLVEISADGGESWVAINHGVRSCYGISGNNLTWEGGKAISGLPDSGTSAAAYGYWTSASTMSRLNIDLSSKIGNQVMLRFRVVTCSHPSYVHNDNAGSGNPGFGGFYVDDVNIYGETTNI